MVKNSGGYGLKKHMIEIYKTMEDMEKLYTGFFVYYSKYYDQGSSSEADWKDVDLINRAILRFEELGQTS